MRATPLKLAFAAGTATSMTLAAPGYLHGFLLGMDGTNDPTITVYNCGTSTTAGKTEVVPTNTYDASALGLNGFTIPMRIHCSEGIAVECTLAAGACEVTMLYSSRPVWQTA